MRLLTAFFLCIGVSLMAKADVSQDIKKYNLLPTIEKFHRSPAQMRCIVGPVGSGKTTGATWEMCYYKPFQLLKAHDMSKTRWCVVRNTYSELRDTTLKTVREWFPWGQWREQRMEMTLQYPDGGPSVEILFRSCDRPDDMKKFKSLEITGFWIDESIEVDEDIKRMLKNRVGRYPRKSPVRFGVETTNPPNVEHPTYHQFEWGDCPPPGPVPKGQPLANHAGFWQPPRENVANLRPGYYDDLRGDYADTPEWIEMYIEGKPGMIVKGALVYNNFKRDYHVAKEPLVWHKGPLYRGWDNSGNSPAAVICQVIDGGRGVQILKEFTAGTEGIVDFTRRVVVQCNEWYPGAEYIEWADPAGHNQYSKRSGGLTSNAKLMLEECGVEVQPSDQAWNARKESVEQALGRIEGVLIDPSCIRLINGFIGGYHYPEIGTTGQYKEAPAKNEYSHVHDALQYVMVKLGTVRKHENILETYTPPYIPEGEQSWMGV